MKLKSSFKSGSKCQSLISNFSLKSPFNEADNLFFYNDVGWMTTWPISTMHQWSFCRRFYRTILNTGRITSSSSIWCWHECSPLHPQYDVGMSATATGSGGASISPHGQRNVATTRIKQINFSIHEDNLLCKSWLEISCDPITNTGLRKESFWLRVSLLSHFSRCYNI
jgi:hypothetical protein